MGTPRQTVEEQPRLPPIPVVQTLRIQDPDDGPYVMLPTRTGDFHMRVRFGKPTSPHLVASDAAVTTTSWDGKRFVFSAVLPPWVKRLPRSLDPSAAIRAEDIRLTPQHACRIVRATMEGYIAAFKPGRIRLVSQA